ncbi:MAG: VanW family protein [Corynebacterium sp.]|uniref:VanW family protein n=1 Tax=Corynebacterium sp. TaxID=1720 RepID=UPI0026DC0A2E|nr:VanW family protein [Corynebacterium sp.]MDO5030080.1 VanW family protein [Corynebacterium sp.]
MTKQQSSSKHRGAKITFGVIVGIFALFGVFFAVDYVLNKGHVPRGSTVAGVDISTLSANHAEAKLEEELGDIATHPVRLRAGERAAEVLPVDAGLSINWEETVNRAGKQTANPITWVRSFFTERELDLVSDVDQAKFQPQVDRLVTELSIPAVDGEVKLVDGRVEQTPPVIGQNVDRTAVSDDLVAKWLLPGGIDIKPTEQDPVIGEDQVREAAEGEAAAAVSSPIIAKGRDNIDGIIPPERMGEIVNFVSRDGKLAADVNVDRAQEILAEGLSETEVEKRNASLRFDGGAREVIPSQDGVAVKWDETMKDFAPRVTSQDERVFDAVYEDKPATYTTEQAEHATFDDVIGEFTTGGFSAASGTNIRLVAQMVNGAFVAPGDTFSLNGYTGPRGTAQGFVESGIILNGHADTAVGGGISQFATTLYNASYFAGMEDVTHTPHSYYISRYPAGREATVYEGAIDLAFKNSSDTPIIIESFATDSEVTVRIKGVKKVDVESVNGGRWAPTSPTTMQVSGDNCQPSSGAPGFTTSDTRIIRDLSGAEISRETTTTVYDPQPIVSCG